MLLQVQVWTVIIGIVLRVEGRSVEQYLRPENAGSPVHNYNDEYSEEQQEYYERQARDASDNGVEKNQRNDVVRGVRGSDKEETNTNVADVGYQSQMNGDDEDLDRAPSNEAGMDRRAMDERGMTKDDTVDADVAEQREDEGLRQDVKSLDPEERAGESSNFRQPREDIAKLNIQEVARTEMIGGGDAIDGGYEGVREPGDKPANEAVYPAADQDHNYNNYNYVQEQDGGDGVESQQPARAANEEGVPQAQYDQAVNK